jgi:hypothetical protein
MIDYTSHSVQKLYRIRTFLKTASAVSVCTAVHCLLRRHDGTGVTQRLIRRHDGDTKVTGVNHSVVVLLFTLFFLSKPN